MKYSPLKKGLLKSLKIKSLDGGLDLSNSPNSISDNQLSDCKNVWFSGGSLKTRPGLSCELNKAVMAEINGVFEKNKYKLHDTGIYINGEYKRIATAESLVDNNKYLCNVFLIGENGDYTSIGSLLFIKSSINSFFIPINIIFYTGKAQRGRGIFVMVALQDIYDEYKRRYEFYEVNDNYTGWITLIDFYVPTLYINGRGNKYEIAKDNSQITTASPKILESPNMLNGRFHSYYTSDGYSNLFRLPIGNLTNDTIVCRINYTLEDYVEWRIIGNAITATKTFFNREITMGVDREKGTVYFYSSEGDYAIPAMSMYNENNIKITATKEIKNSKAKILYSSCALNFESRIIVSGGENRNEIFAADCDNPLYFPQNSCAKVGKADSEVVSFSMQNGKIVALKNDGVYEVSLKAGKRINDISLLADNDKSFYESDSFDIKEISNIIGCKNKNCTAVLNGNTVFLGNDGKIYCLTSLNGEGLKCISNGLDGKFNLFGNADFAFAGNNKYIIFKDNNAFVGINESSGKFNWYYWEFPQKFEISGGLFSKNTPMLLCAVVDTKLSYIAYLNDFKDSYIEYDQDDELVKRQSPVESFITTKCFGVSAKRKKFESIYISLASKGTISILVNGKQIADLNLRLSDKEYQNNGYKSVKLLPYLNDKSSLYITLFSNKGINIGDLEINYI